MADTLEMLQLKLQNAQLAAQLAGTQAEMLRERHRELMGQISGLQQAIAQHDAAQKALLERIARAAPEELPSLVTRQIDGQVVVLDAHTGDYRPLTVVEQAWMARLNALREAAGGQA